MLGFNAEQVYRDEMSDLSKDRSKIGFDLGDIIRQGYGAIIQKDYSREGLRKGAKALLEAEINDKNTTQQETIRQGLGGTGYTLNNLEIGKNETEKEYKARLAGLQSKAQAASTYLTTPNADPRKITNGMSTNNILGLATQQVETNRVDQENKAIDREDTLLERESMRQERSDIRQDKRLAADRAMSADQNMMQLQFQYAQLAQQDRNRAQDREDKALMMLLQGLGNLGAAFTV